MGSRKRKLEGLKVGRFGAGSGKIAADAFGFRLYIGKG